MALLTVAIIRVLPWAGGVGCTKLRCTRTPLLQLLDHHRPDWTLGRDDNDDGTDGTGPF